MFKVAIRQGFFQRTSKPYRTLITWARTFILLTQEDFSVPSQACLYPLEHSLKTEFE